jgi:EpsI family protein
MNRRALVAGALCVGGALAAQQLRPHRYVSLLRQAKLDDLVPRSFGSWTSEDAGDPLALNGPGTLSSKLYSQLVTRLYADGKGGQVLMLLAHGERQDDELQLHRPEICFPAFGYQLLIDDPVQLPLGGQVKLPARRLLARSANDEERVIYWTRIGEYFPLSAGEQKRARFQNTLAGVVPDGILCRFTTGNTAAAWSGLHQFLLDLMKATAPAGRRALVGSERSLALQQRA